jgi:hypothetical protein
VGVSNLSTFMYPIPPHWKPLLPKFHEVVGHPERDKERLARTSPALNAEKSTSFAVRWSNSGASTRSRRCSATEGLRAVSTMRR